MVKWSIKIITVKGNESLVDHLWKKSGGAPLVNHRLCELNRDGSGWVATTNEHVNKTEFFDAVVFTMPVPQFLYDEQFQPKGDFLDVVKRDDDVYTNLREVVYNSVYSLGLVYTEPTDLGLTWSDKYFPSHPVIRYISTKYNANGQTSIVVQSHRSWAQDNLKTLSKDDATPILLDAVRELIPNLPKPSYWKSHRWRFSQTSTPYPGTPGAVLLARQG